MEIQFSAEIEKKLNDLAAESGRPAAELVRDAVAGMIDFLATTRTVLDARYQQLETGRVDLVPADEVFGRLREKSQSRRGNPGE